MHRLIIEHDLQVGIGKLGYGLFTDLEVVQRQVGELKLIDRDHVVVAKLNPLVCYGAFVNVR